MTTEEYQPNLSVQIPNPWPVRVSEIQNHNFSDAAETVAKTSAAEEDKKSIQKLQNLFIDKDPSTSSSSTSSSSITITSSTRPSLKAQRSLSNRQNSIPTTKIIAAAISTQSDSSKSKREKRRLRMASNPSSCSSSFSDHHHQEHVHFPKHLTSSSDEGEVEFNDNEKFNTLPKSKAQSLRKIIEQQRRHSRSNSVPNVDPTAKRLHIDTFLPLQLPPVDLCAKSPLLAYPNSWWASQTGENKKVNEEEVPVTVTEQDHGSASSSSSSSSESESETYSSLFSKSKAISSELRRSESLASFISAQSDGSWHGDQGDNDPDGQLARALGRLDSSQQEEKSISSSSSFGTEAMNLTRKDGLPSSNEHGPVQIQTYDYDEESERSQEQSEIVAEPSISSIADDDDIKHAISKEGEPLLTKLSSFLYNLKLFGGSEDIQKEDESVENFSPLERSMSHSASDGNLFGQLSSPHSLQTEMKSSRSSKPNRKYTSQKWSSTRTRSATVAADLDLFNHGEVDEEDVSNAFGLWSLWRWIVPDIDTYLGDLDEPLTKNKNKNKNYNSYLKRNPSLPSLISGSSLESLIEDEEDQEWDEQQQIENDLMESLTTLSDSFHPFESERFYGESVQLIKNQQYPKTNLKINLNSPLKQQQNNNNDNKRSFKPSPLWDNRLDNDEEPYQRSWSSMLGLSVH